MSKSSTALHRYSVLEEIFNARRMAWALLGVVGLILLTMKALNIADGAILAAALIYGISIILLFAASTLYHAIPHTPTSAPCAPSTTAPSTCSSPAPTRPLHSWSSATRWVRSSWRWSGAGRGRHHLQDLFVGRFHTISLITYLGMGWPAGGL